MKRWLCHAAVLPALLVAIGAGALVSTQKPGALLVFPLITIENGGTTDTLIQLTNADDVARRAACAYEDPSTGPGFTSFIIGLTANQPIAWRASQGLAAVPSGDGSIPALGTAHFTGVLRCHTVDAGGAPTDVNALVGLATLVSAVDAPASLDSAAYAATAFGAAAGAVNGDAQLVLGGPAAEYEACPQAVLVPVLLDGATFDLGSPGTVQRQVSTTVAVTTCGARTSGSTDVAMAFTLVNEFGQLSTFLRTVSDQLVIPLADLDPGASSVFRAATQGSLHGTLRITPQPTSGGVLALTLQHFADPDSGANPRSAALEAQLDGERSAADIIEVPPTTAPACAGDCNGDGSVAINELILGVNIALNTQAVSACLSFDTNHDGAVLINELVAAVGHALTGC